MVINVATTSRTCCEEEGVIEHVDAISVEVCLLYNRRSNHCHQLADHHQPNKPHALLYSFPVIVCHSPVSRVKARPIESQPRPSLQINPLPNPPHQFLDLLD